LFLCEIPQFILYADGQIDTHARSVHSGVCHLNLIRWAAGLARNAALRNCALAGGGQTQRQSW
jgi:hypothetical protein